MHLRNDRHLGMDDLVRRIETGRIDTVIVAFTDMQGRLQGKRLHGRYFVDHVVEHGTEGCNYLLAVDVDMNTVDGYAISSWEKGYGDMEFVLDERTIRRADPPRRRPRWCSATWSGRPTARATSTSPSSSRRGRSCRPSWTAAPRTAGRPWPAPSWSSSPSTRRARTPTTRATAA